jgi:hypothetical protein
MAEALGFRVTAFSKPLAVCEGVASVVAAARAWRDSQHGATVTFTLSEVEKNNPAPSIDSRTSAEALSVVLEVKVWNTPSIEMVPRNF